jgi:hypothetical protein
MTGNTVVPSMWQDLPQGGPMLMAADTAVSQAVRTVRWVAQPEV